MTDRATLVVSIGPKSYFVREIMKIETKHPLAFVLSGGGARGAYQVGALKALLEAGLKPDILVGTSIGAVNSAYLALRGVNLDGVESLKIPWSEVYAADLFPTQTVWLTMRILFDRMGWQPDTRLRDFFQKYGLVPDLRFKDIKGVRLLLVSSDLNSGSAVVYGTDPDQSVLEGLLASTALPPWAHPLELESQLLVDGGVVSNLPIETALSQGAKEIVALDLSDLRALPRESRGFGPFADRIMNSVIHRQHYLESELARLMDVPVHYLPLRSDLPAAFLDFHEPFPLMDEGYRITKAELEKWQKERKSGLFGWLSNLIAPDPHR